jgi:hypothetical protein
MDLLLSDPRLLPIFWLAARRVIFDRISENPRSICHTVNELRRHFGQRSHRQPELEKALPRERKIDCNFRRL